MQLASAIPAPVRPFRRVDAALRHDQPRAGASRRPVSAPRLAAVAVALLAAGATVPVILGATAGSPAATTAAGTGHPSTGVAQLGGRAVGGVSSATAHVARAGGLVAVGSVAQVPPGLTPLGTLSGATRLHVGIALEPGDPAGLAAYAAAVSNPSSPAYRHYLTPTQVTAAFGPAETSVRAAEQLLRSGGLAVGAVPANRLVVPAVGTAAQIEALFHTSIARYRLHGGSLGWAAASAPMLPRSLASSVITVNGLDNLVAPSAFVEHTPPGGSPSGSGIGARAAGAAGRTRAHGAAGAATGAATPADLVRQRSLIGASGASPATVTSLPTACNAALQTSILTGGWTEDSIANAFGFAGLLTKGDLGQGQTIAIFESDPFEMSDIAAFEKCYFGRSRTDQLTQVPVDGYHYTGAGPEATLDIEEIAALAPDAKLLVYNAPPTDDLDEYEAIVSQDRANIVSISYGACETQAEQESPGVLQVENDIFEEAAAQGMTVLASSGDTGADICASSQFGQSPSPAGPYRSVGDPASQPYVVGVGGVSLETDTTPPQETTWNDGASFGSSGGGISNTWKSPAWQANSGVPGTVAGKRSVPDVAGMADELRGVTMYSASFGGFGASRSAVRILHLPSELGGRPLVTLPGAASSAALPNGTAVPNPGAVPAPGTLRITGATGPAGPSGATGASGSSGPTGASGPGNQRLPVPPGWITEGGTSAAAPQWAAALALIADSTSCSALPKTAGGRDLGWVLPYLYQIAAKPSSYAASFTQVLKGTNDEYGLQDGFSAGPGYNRVTGLGTPILVGAQGQPGLAANLCALATGHATTGPVVPAISGVSPQTGSPSGGTTVTITGRHFAARASLVVDFGDEQAHVVSATPTSIVVTAPKAAIVPHSPGSANPGTVEVTVSERSGGVLVTSSPAPAAAFHYLADAATGSGGPTVASMDPVAGNIRGGNTVRIFGSGFTSGSGTPTVTFGGVAAASVRVVSDSVLVATVPPKASSTACATGTGFDPAFNCQVQVVVTTSAGSSPQLPISPGLSGPVAYGADAVVQTPPEEEAYEAPTEYDYGRTPVITSITPSPASAAGSSPIAIRGRNLDWLLVQDNGWIDFGPWRDLNSLTNQPVLYETSREIVIDPPASPGGASPGTEPFVLKGGVTVQSGAGRSNTVPFSYAGIPDVTKLTGAAGGPQTGGAVVTVHGAGLGDVAFVAVASLISPNYQYSLALVLHHAGDSALTVRLPAYQPGPAVVVPCTNSGCARLNPKTDTFVYYDAGSPTLLGASSASGPASGGTQVLLVGFDLDSATAVYFGKNKGTILRLPQLTLYPDGDPFLLGVAAAPGAPGSTVPISVVTPTGTTTTTKGVFHYLASAPSPPTKTGLSPGGTTTVLHWAPPITDGGSPVTGYEVNALPLSGGRPASASLPASARSYAFHDLSALAYYSFTVTASNARGAGPAATVPSVQVPYRQDGYRVLTSGGAVLGFGSLPSLGGIAGPSGSPAIGIATTHDGEGYWVVQADGSVTNFGDAPPLRYEKPASQVVAIASTGSGLGYWLLEKNGTVLGFGDAKTYGSAGGLSGADPAVALATVPGDKGYIVLTRAGRLYGFGSGAALRGQVKLPAGTSAVGLALEANSFQLLASNGDVVAFPGGKATLVLPAAAGKPVAIVSTPDRHGDWILSSTGKVVGRGDARTVGSGLQGSVGSAVSIAAA